jgi:DNA-binding GntR family transcriptional regulator
VSVTPIREGLKILAGEGLVAISPRHGATVASVSDGELRSLQVVQEGLEHLALDLLGGEWQSDRTEEFEALVVAAEKALGREDIPACRDLSESFHQKLIELSGNSHLMDMYNLVLRKSQIMDLYYPRAIGDIAASIDEHRSLVAAMRTGNVGSVGSILRAHWRGTVGRLEVTHPRPVVLAGADGMPAPRVHRPRAQRQAKSAPRRAARAKA